MTTPAPVATLVPVPDGSITSPQGFTAAAVHAGLKADGAPDVALLVSAASCATAGVFTSNVVRAAPVLYDADLLGERPGRVGAGPLYPRRAEARPRGPRPPAARTTVRA